MSLTLLTVIFKIMYKEKIAAFAPATIANLAVGFDVLGYAMNSVGDTVELTKNGKQLNRITHIENGANLPFDLEQNCCSVVIQKMQESLNLFVGVDIVIKKGFESKSGMGSSSASSAAAALAYNALIGDPFTKEELVQFAMEGERIACGAAHADNVAPAILGGLVLLRQESPFSSIHLPIPDGLYVLVFFPKVEIKTADSRSVISNAISLKKASQQWARMGAFVSSLYQNDIQLLGQSMEDLIVEESRSILIPNYTEMKAIAKQEGAISFGISGSGPSIFCLFDSKEKAEYCRIKLEELFVESNISHQTYIEAFTVNQGAKLLNAVLL
jgi:homoserine kinase